MPFQAIVHDAVWREVEEAAHDELRAAMRALCRLASPARAANVRALEASAYPKSYRLRVGRHRVLFLLLPDEEVIAFTTAFLKRRESDYGAAVDRHDARVRAYE